MRLNIEGTSQMTFKLFGRISVLALPLLPVPAVFGTDAGRDADAVPVASPCDDARTALNRAGEPGLALVALKQVGALVALDGLTGEERWRVGLGADGASGPDVGPHEVALTADGRTAVVSLYGSAAVGNELIFVSVDRGEIDGRLALGEFERPHGLAFVGPPDDQRLLVTAERQQRLLVIDPRARYIEATHGTVQAASHMVAASEDGARAYVSNSVAGSVSVIDLHAERESGRSVERVVFTGPGAEGIAVRPGAGEGSGEVWVANSTSHAISIVDPETLNVSASMACPLVPIRVAFTPDGSRALVTSAGSGDLVVFDAAERREIARVALASPEHYDGVDMNFGPSSVPVGMVVSPSGRFVYVSSMVGGFVSVVDLESNSVVRVMDMGDSTAPDGIAFVARS
jgi:DNA-binding beta-propeller fold protein YncE